MPTTSSSSSARPPGRRAILLMIGAAGCFASNDALVKFVSQSLAPAQVILLRSVIASVLILLVARRAGATPHLAAAVSPRVLGRCVADAFGTSMLYLTRAFFWSGQPNRISGAPSGWLWKWPSIAITLAG